MKNNPAGRVAGIEAQRAAGEDGVVQVSTERSGIPQVPHDYARRAVRKPLPIILGSALRGSPNVPLGNHWSTLRSCHERSRAGYLV